MCSPPMRGTTAGWTTNAVDGPSAHQVERHSHSSVAVTYLAAFIRHTAEGAVEPTKLRAPGTERLGFDPGRCSRCLRSAMFASRWMWGDVTKESRTAMDSCSQCPTRATEKCRWRLLMDYVGRSEPG